MTQSVYKLNLRVEAIAFSNKSDALVHEDISLNEIGRDFSNSRMIQTVHKDILIEGISDKPEDSAPKDDICLNKVSTAMSIQNLGMDNLFSDKNPPRSLISTFVVRCLDSITSLVVLVEISRLWLASVAEQAGLSLWSHTPKTGFLMTKLKR